MSEPLVAKTHPRAYMLHKYWARKPHNILAHYIEQNFTAGQLVVDPFSGSGVFLAEAKKQGLDVVGIDLNPLASLLSDVTINPPNDKQLKDAIDTIIESVQYVSDSYRLTTGERVRYLVHEMVSVCSKCNTESSSSDIQKSGNKYLCPKCSERIYFNFNSFSHTRITEIVTDKSVIKRGKDTLHEFERQETLSANLIDPASSPFDKPLIVNRRILAFPGMKSSDLFTKRNFTIASKLFSDAHKIKDKAIRNAVLLFLTSNIAQISRLIPYRNGLSTGGQAWTVPGFWIAPVHLESNPVKHLVARSKKFINGVADLNKSYEGNKNKSTIYNDDMRNVLQGMPTKSVDGFFFDPPYGDSVPYLEFSVIWNVFLNENVEYQKEVIVSDRAEHISKWDSYSASIDESIGLMESRLKDTGKIIMTFNNLDPKAWKAILSAFKRHSLHCIEADYQIPAVISSKAQFAADTSYVGDFYCVFNKAVAKQPKNGTETLLNSIIPILVQRDGKVPQNVLKRACILTILQENLELELFDSLEDVIHGVALKDETRYVMRTEVFEKYRSKSKVADLHSFLVEFSRTALSNGRLSVKDFYLKLVNELADSSTPTIEEVTDILNGTVLFEKNYCYLQETQDTAQPQLSLGLK